MIVWFGFAALFLIYEGYAILTKERYTPTLSRTIWRLTDWTLWMRIADLGEMRIKPLRWLLFAIMAWATIHLVFGPCAFGIC